MCASPTGLAQQLNLLRLNVGLTQLDVAVDDVSGATASVLVPSDQDALLNMYITNERELGGLTPYYGVVWPSALALCKHVGSSQIAKGSAVLELGCGVGLAGIAAAVTGAPRSVLLTDLDPIAVQLAQLGAERSGVAAMCSGAVLDWHDLAAWPAAAFDVALAADVIYEPAACDGIASVLEHTLKPGGVLLLADGKGRVNRHVLWAALEQRGFALEREQWVEVASDASDSTRGHVDRRLREEASAQSVLLARFVRSSSASG